MNNFGARRIPNAVALLVERQVVREINHELPETLVEQAGLLPRGASEHIRRGADALHFLSPGVVKVGAVIAVHHTAFGKKLVPVQGLQQERSCSGETANAVLYRTIGVQQFRATRRDIGMFVHEVNHGTERIADQQRVAV